MRDGLIPTATSASLVTVVPPVASVGAMTYASQTKTAATVSLRSIHVQVRRERDEIHSSLVLGLLKRLVGGDG